MIQCRNCFELYNEYEQEQCPYCNYRQENDEDADTKHLQIGTQLQLGRYQIGKCLGSGGFGITYLAWDENQGRKVAIKEFFPSQFAARENGFQVTVMNQSAQEIYQHGKNLFQEEAKKLARFHDIPEIVSVMECFEENGTAYIVMKFIEGENLEQYLQRKEEETGRPGVDDCSKAIEILLPLMKAMKLVHENHTYHLDISPDNIMINKEEKATLIDFGIAKNLFGEEDNTYAYKRYYSPIEQYEKTEPTPCTDVYAMAAIFYRMLTGEPPIDARLRMQSCKNKKKDSLKPVNMFRSDVSENVQTALLNALNLLPINRTQNMQAFMWELTTPAVVVRKKEKWKKIDLSDWPLWGRIFVPAGAVALITFGILFGTGVIGFRSGLEKRIVLEEGKSRVPSMINYTVNQAAQAAQSSGLGYVIKGKEYSYVVPKGYVMSQDIHAGSVVDAGTKVGFVISAGGELVHLPSLEGTLAADAEKRLESLGVQAKLVMMETSAMSPGEVIGVEGNEYVEKGSEVIVYVAEEPKEIPAETSASASESEAPSVPAQTSPLKPTDSSKPNGDNNPVNDTKPASPTQPTQPIQPTTEAATEPETQDIPDLVGMPYINAVMLLKGRSDITLKVSDKRYDEKADTGIILEQREEKHENKTFLYVTLSMGKSQTVLIPDVTLMEKEEAIQLLLKNGFKYEIVEIYSNEAPEGFVISQKPEGSEAGESGQSIILTVSIGSKQEETTEEETDDVKQTTEETASESVEQSDEIETDFGDEETISTQPEYEETMPASEETKSEPNYFESQGSYYVTGANQDAVLTYCGSAGAEEVIIFSYVEGYSITGIIKGSFKNCVGLKRLQICEGIRNLDADLFSSLNWENELQIIVPNSVETIGEYPFPLNATIIAEEGSKAYQLLTEQGYRVMTEQEPILPTQEMATQEPTEIEQIPEYFEEQGSCYVVDADQKAVLTYCGSAAEEEVVVFPYVNEYSVKGIINGAFKDCFGLKRLQICEGIRSLDTDLFSSANWGSELQIIVPDSVEEISANPFPMDAIIIAPENSLAYIVLISMGYQVVGGYDFLNVSEPITEPAMELISSSTELSELPNINLPNETEEQKIGIDQPEVLSSSAEIESEEPETTKEPEEAYINIYVNTDYYAETLDERNVNTNTYIAENGRERIWLEMSETGMGWKIMYAWKNDMNHAYTLTECTDVKIGITDLWVYYYDGSKLMRISKDGQTKEEMLAAYDIVCIDYCLSGENVYLIGMNGNGEIGLYYYKNADKSLWNPVNFAEREVPEFEHASETALYYFYQGKYYWYNELSGVSLVSDQELFAESGYYFFRDESGLMRADLDGKNLLHVLPSAYADNIRFNGGMIYSLVNNAAEGQILYQYDLEGNWMNQWYVNDLDLGYQISDDWLYNPQTMEWIELEMY